MAIRVAGHEMHESQIVPYCASGLLSVSRRPFLFMLPRFTVLYDGALIALDI